MSPTPSMERSLVCIDVAHQAKLSRVEYGHVVWSQSYRDHARNRRLRGTDFFNAVEYPASTLGSYKTHVSKPG